MADHRVVVTLTESLYQRARETAEAASLSLEEVLETSIRYSLPALEDELPKQVRAGLARLSLFKDSELWQLIDVEMDDSAQNQLEYLAEEQKLRPLAEAEKAELAELLAQAESIMLQKAEAYRLLSLRGYEVFPTPSNSGVSDADSA